MEGLDMAVTPDPIKGVFIQVTRDALRIVVQAAVAAGIEPAWCLDTIDEIVATVRKDLESETSAGGSSAGT